MKMTSDAVEILETLVSSDTEMQAMLEEEREKLRIARIVYEARTAARLTQAELAARVGTRQSVIVKLEDADYTGNTLNMLTRIALALDRRVEVRLVSRQSQVNGQRAIHKTGNATTQI